MEQLFYKRAVNKSVLCDGFGINQDYLPFFLDAAPTLKRGEVRQLIFLFQGNSYPVKLYNLNNDPGRRRNDTYQIRYTANGEFARALQGAFFRTHHFIQEAMALKAAGEGHSLKVPKEYEEYIAIYTTDQADVFECEAILRDDMQALQEAVQLQSERHFEAVFNFEIEDKTATIRNREMIARVRKLNRKIGDYLKAKYDYRCQICGQKIGARYSSNLVEAHHIDYFVKSLNNNSSNQLIVCPNHHGIIHDTNPVFNRKNLTYKYPNGLVEGLKLNLHL